MRGGFIKQNAFNKEFKENRQLHFVGLRAVGGPYISLLRYITKFLILCEVIEGSIVEKIVFSSSATVYGTLR